MPCTLAMVGIDQYDEVAVANMSATLNIDIPKKAGVDAVYTMVLVALPTVERLPNELDDDWRVYGSVGPVLFSNEPQHLHLTHADTVKVALNESLVALALGEHASGDFPVKYDGLAVHRAKYKLVPETRVQGHVDDNGIQQDVPVSPSHDPNAIDVVDSAKSYESRIRVRWSSTSNSTSFTTCTSKPGEALQNVQKPRTCGAAACWLTTRTSTSAAAARIRQTSWTPSKASTSSIQT